MKIKIKAKDITFIVIMLVFFAIIILPVFNSFNPVRVVASESMVPTLNKGDIIFVVPCDIKDVSVGDIIAYRSQLQHGEIVAHRVIEKRVENKSVFLITKGDANEKSDQEYGENYVTQKNFFGKVLMIDDHVFKIPYLGYIAYGLMRAGTPYSIEKKNLQWTFILFFTITMFTISFFDSQNKQKKKIVYVYRNERIKPLHAFLILFVSFLLIFLLLHSTVAYAEKKPSSPMEKVFVYNPTEVPMKGVVLLKSQNTEKAIVFSINPEEIKVMNERYGEAKEAIVYSSFFWFIFPESFIENLAHMGFWGVVFLDVISAAITALGVIFIFYLADILIDIYHYGKYRRMYQRRKSIIKTKIIYKKDLIIISGVVGIFAGIILSFSLYGLLLIPILAILLRTHPYIFSSSTATGFTFAALYLNSISFAFPSTIFVLVVAIYSIIYAYSIFFSRIVAEVVYNETV